MTALNLKRGGILLSGADFSDVAMNKSAYIGYDTILAPSDWSPENEPVNIIVKFRESKINKKMFIIAIPDEATTVDNNSPYTNVPTRFYETINGEETETKVARGTSWTPTVGSTKRYAIFSGDYSPDVVRLSGAYWAHFGDVFGPILSITTVITSGKDYIEKITFDRNVITTIETNFWPKGTGILYLPATLTQLGYGFNTGSLKAVVSYATEPPIWSGTAGGYTIRCDVFVPDDSVAAYKAAVRWSNNASRIRPLSEFDIANYIDT